MSPYFHVDKEDAAMQCVVLKKKIKVLMKLNQKICLFFYDTSPFSCQKAGAYITHKAMLPQAQTPGA